MKFKFAGGQYNMTSSIARNIVARSGRGGTHWDAGEQQRLIDDAIKRGKVTKCQPGYTLDQGTMGLTEFNFRGSVSDES